MKKLRLLFILFILLIPNVVKADKCGFAYEPDGWLCYPYEGTMFHCIDPGAASASFYEKGGFLYVGVEDDSTLLSYTSNGLTDEVIHNIRNSRRAGGNVFNLSKTYSNGLSKLRTLSNNSADLDVNANITWTEDTGWVDPLINDRKSNRKFSKKFNLSIEVTGDMTDVNINYSVNVSGGGSFKLAGATQGPANSNVSTDIIVYSDTMIDASTVVLTANVNASKTYKVLKRATIGAADGSPGQMFIGLVDGGTKTRSFSGTTSFPVTKTCQYKIVTDEKGQEYPEYTMHIVRPGTNEAEEQKVDAITYMSKGCCSDVQPKFFNTKTAEGREAIEYYKNNCMTKDLVSYENECGTDSCTGDGNYKSYSTSFVWQVPMDTLKKNVLNDIKFSDINSDNDKLKHYYDETLSNKYCKVVTSEDNEIYFPTTAVATSGRFFVFQELNKSQCDLSNLNYNSKTCFRQPYIHGTINLYVVNDYATWKSEYDAAMNTKNSVCNSASGNDSNSLQNSVACLEATEKVNTLLAAKSSCENTINNFTYNLEPKLTFYYEQEYYNGNKNTLITEEANMYATKTTDTPVKYWPNVTSEVTKKYNTEYKFESNTVYENTYEKTVYYRPELNSYSLLPSGEVKTRSFQSVSKTLENGLEVGYVYNVKVTSYEGVYNTWFDITNLGNGGENSNLHKMVIQEYKAASRKDYGNDESLMFKSQCKYCMEEGSFERQCSTCEELDAKFVFRNVALDDITPNVSSRDDGTNWVDEKGNAAKWLISQTADNNIAVANSTNNKEMLSGNSKDVKVTTLESSDNKVNVVQTANDYIYDDSTGTYLEYDITLTPEDMRLIKANNRKIDYATLNLCANNNTGSNTKSADEDYCFKCNQDGKECESTFIDAYGDQIVTLNTRQKKWKYYFYNTDNPDKSTFIKGTMASGDVLAALKKIQGNEDGRYPDPENQQGWLNTYKNWP